MDDTIAKAWADMVTKLPVDEDDLRRIAHQVADELIRAGAPEGTDIAGVDKSQSITLGRGFSLEISERTLPSPNWMLRITLTVSRSHGSNRLTYIAAQCSPRGGNLGVFPPDGHSAVMPWTEEDGDQRPWLLQNLRQQVADFIGG